MKKMVDLIPQFEKELLHLNRNAAAEIFDKAFHCNKSFDDLETLTMNALVNIGAGWENGVVSLSQVYMSGVICEELIEKYLPKLEIKRKDIPKIAIAVLLDHHALGKRIVYSIIRAGGLEIEDFGQGISIDDLVEKTIGGNIAILLISTLMLPSALKVKLVKEKLITRGCSTKIIVGGAPFRLDNNLWKRVDADADGKNASTIIQTIELLLKGGDESL